MLGEDFRADRARIGPRALREPALWAIAVYRFGRRTLAQPPSRRRDVKVKLAWALHSVVEVITGVSLPLGASVGPGLRIHHFGGVFIHNDAVIGRNCTLRQGVTIGNREDDGPAPVIEDDVEFGAYAQVLGGIRIGRGARIGAMSVVLSDVPPGASAVGIPARMLDRGAAT
jgi:serine O-acetyltransferase